MAKIDQFTRRRLTRFIDEFRKTKAHLPTLKDFQTQGFTKVLVAGAVKEGLIVELYATLTTGAVVKGYKVVSR